MRDELDKQLDEAIASRPKEYSPFNEHGNIKQVLAEYRLKVPLRLPDRGGWLPVGTLMKIIKLDDCHRVARAEVLVDNDTVTYDVGDFRLQDNLVATYEFSYEMLEDYAEKVEEEDNAKI